jgi:acetyl-CoA synthetase
VEDQNDTQAGAGTTYLNTKTADASARREQLDRLNREFEADPEKFWDRQARELLSCTKTWDTVLEGSFSRPPIRWFSGAELNASFHCLDRHLENGKSTKTALIWQGENEDDVEEYTYGELHTEVCRFANVLKKKGIVKGDCVSIYLPMVPELTIAILACARIGAVHSVVFSGFSPVSLKARIRDCKSKLLITADAINRAGRILPLKTNTEEALADVESLASCIVVRRTQKDVTMTPGRDSWYHDEVAAPDISTHCDVEPMQATDTLFVLYTSGSTGRPKGVAHSTGGYLLYALYSCRLVFGLKDEDIFWCTADIGWITGHTYGIYGTLGLGGTSLIYEGIPLYPGPDRYWKIIEKFKVTIFYTAPTVIRALMRFGSEPADQHDLSSLRLLGSVGEPINPEAWNWYKTHIGKNRLRLVDTWWQTETGGAMIAPLVDSPPEKAGSAALPLPAVDLAIIDENGEEVTGERCGRLVIRKPWPGIYKEICGEEKRSEIHFAPDHQDSFDTGDGARRDKDGCYWITGRLDDVINVSGHRLGTVEIESALLTHNGVAEAAVVGIPHALKGQAVYAYVTTKINIERSENLLEELRSHVRSEIGPLASPDSIQYAPSLPKTRSGKIMRRVLQRIASDDTQNFGDISSLADPSVIADLIEGKIKGSNL